MIERAHKFLDRIREKISLHDFQQLNRLIDGMSEAEESLLKKFALLIDKYEALVDEGFCISKVAYLMEDKMKELLKKTGRI